MNITIIIASVLTTFLGVFTLKIGMGYAPLPFRSHVIGKRIYTGFSALLCTSSLFLIALCLPLLQTVFTWLGLISICGLLWVVITPSSTRKH